MNHFTKAQFLKCLLVLLASAQACETSAEVSAAVNDVTGALLGADGPRALALLRSPAGKALSGRDAAFRSCVISRLNKTEAVPAPILTDAKLRSVLGAYRTYWRVAAMSPGARGRAENGLSKRLRAILGPRRSKGVDSFEPAIEKAAARAGVHVLLGKTGYLFEMMLWTKQSDRDVEVKLVEGTQAARVHYLDGFASLGWSEYLTCGRASTGGWTNADGLYAVVPGYKSLDDENFRINFLAHEAQHLADKNKFPSLVDWELEYRAKLVELAQAVTTRQDILGRFAADQGDDPSSSHSYANKRVLLNLRSRLGLRSDQSLSEADPGALRSAAAAELRHDTLSRAVPSAERSPR